MSKLLDPVADYERHFAAPVFSSLWATLGFSVVAVLVGMRVTAPVAAGGLGLSIGQFALVAPVSLIAAGLLAAVVATMAFESGLNAGMLSRPSFGVAGSWVVSAIIVLSYVGWMALELRAIGEIVAVAVADAPVGISIIVAAGVAGALAFVGLQRVTARVIRPVLLWLALFSFVGLALWLFRQDLVLIETTAGPGMLLVAGQDIFLYTVIFLPLIADSSRFAQASSAAVSSTGFAFTAAVAACMVVGALIGAVGTSPTTTSLASAALASGAVLGVIVALAWVVGAELTQPFGFLYAATSAASAVFLRRPPRLSAWFAAGIAGLVAIVYDEQQLWGAAQLAAFLILPAFAILIIDYFVVRRSRYLVDEMYARTGEYGGVNLVGFASYALGLLVGFFVEPRGPRALLDGVESLVPAAGAWADTVPAVLVGAVVSALAYWGLGSWRVADEDVVSHVRL